MNEIIDFSSNFYSILYKLFDFFQHILETLDSLYLFEHTSILDFNIAVVVLTIVFAVVFNVVRSSVVNSSDSVSSARRSKSKQSKESK